jgi:asparagine synthase (glutamine-hydrolysing)
MCGIFGFSGFKKPDMEKARLALYTLHHRGPDQWNEYFDESVYIGHRRLSIIDLSENGKQPMTNEDKSVWVTVNGEIYNFKELRRQLENKYSFKSKSDSEVVVYGYKEWGIEGLLERIDGMYAIVIYDKIKHQLFLARDRYGIKPLFFSIEKSGDVAWASELKAIVEFKGEENLTLDSSALYDFFTYQYIPAPKTLYQNIYKLEPAHYLTFDVTTKIYKKTCYWELEVQSIVTDSNMAVKEIQVLLSNSVKEQLVSDVPIGCFLSGGIDSSIVVSIASKEISEVNTFNISFENNPRDESHYAELIAKKFKTKHYKQELPTSILESNFDDIKKWYDEPFGDLSCFPSFLVSKFAKEKVTVALTGDGGDELFGGYKWYKAFSLARKVNLSFLSFLYKPFVQIVALLPFKGEILKYMKRVPWLFLNDLELYTKLMGGLIKNEKAQYREKLGISKSYDDYWFFRKYYKTDIPIFTRLRFLDFHTYLPEDILTKVDRVSMAVALECRVPFLKRALVEYVFSIPENMLMPNGELKGLLKETYKTSLPKEIIERDKEGFNIPAASWENQVKGGYKNRMDRIVTSVFKINTH